jgi:2-iminoacetate synthase ThiH
VSVGLLILPPGVIAAAAAAAALQTRTRGITEFVPLPFVHMEAPVFLQGAARRGPTLRECVLLHAVSRLVLHPVISNIQASWVKMGPDRAAALLAAGCNDMGGSIMNESITRAAGGSSATVRVPVLEGVCLKLSLQPLPGLHHWVYKSECYLQFLSVV